MAIELKIPQVGESITEVEIGGWLKNQGQSVQKDEPVVTIESEKATVELPAPEAGVLSKIVKQKGETARVGEVIGYLEKDGAKTKEPTPSREPEEALASRPGEPAPKPKSESKPAAELKPAAETKSETPASEPRSKPVAERTLAERKPRAEAPEPAPEDRRTKEEQKPAVEPRKVQSEPPTESDKVQIPAEEQHPPSGARQEEVVPMSRLRRTVAERLIEAQRNAALVTTFNELDMSEVLALRRRHGEAFRAKYNVKLGLMSFFVKACIHGLKEFPMLNAEVRGTNIVYHNYFDIGVAIGGGKGLVVPVLRNAELLSFAEIELAIADFARRAKENTLKIEELQGGTFTISNGGVYGSLLSTPIINPPQSGVLGMHAFQDRPVVRDGAIVIRPMMFVALTYDHRLVDGREAVTFLIRVKEVIESPARMLMEV